jgi:hypothetical protein
LEREERAERRWDVFRRDLRVRLVDVIKTFGMRGEQEKVRSRIRDRAESR